MLCRYICGRSKNWSNIERVLVFFNWHQYVLVIYQNQLKSTSKISWPTCSKNILMVFLELTVHNLGTAVIQKSWEIFQPRSHKLPAISFIIISCSFGQCSSCLGPLYSWEISPHGWMHIAKVLWVWLCSSFSLWLKG